MVIPALAAKHQADYESNTPLPFLDGGSATADVFTDDCFFMGTPSGFPTESPLSWNRSVVARGDFAAGVTGGGKTPHALDLRNFILEKIPGIEAKLTQEKLGILSTKLYEPLAEKAAEVFASHQIDIDAPEVVFYLEEILPLWGQLIRNKYLSLDTDKNTEMAIAGFRALLHWNILMKGESALGLLMTEWTRPSLFSNPAPPAPEKFFNSQDPSYKAMENLSVACSHSRVAAFIPQIFINMNFVNDFNELANHTSLLDQLFSLSSEQLIIFGYIIGHEFQTDIKQIEALANYMTSDGRWDIYNVASGLIGTYAQMMRFDYSITLPSFKILCNHLDTLAGTETQERQIFSQAFGLIGSEINPAYNPEQDNRLQFLAHKYWNDKWSHVGENLLWDLYDASTINHPILAAASYTHDGHIYPFFLKDEFIFKQGQSIEDACNPQSDVPFVAISKLIQRAEDGGPGLANLINYFPVEGMRYGKVEGMFPHENTGAAIDFKKDRIWLEHLADLARMAGDSSYTYLMYVLPLAINLGWIKSPEELTTETGGLGERLAHLAKTWGDRGNWAYDYLYKDPRPMPNHSFHDFIKKPTRYLIHQAPFNTFPTSEDHPLFHLGEEVNLLPKKNEGIGGDEEDEEDEEDEIIQYMISNIDSSPLDTVKSLGALKNQLGNKPYWSQFLQMVSEFAKSKEDLDPTNPQSVSFYCFNIFDRLSKKGCNVFLTLIAIVKKLPDFKNPDDLDRNNPNSVTAHVLKLIGDVSEGKWTALIGMVTIAKNAGLIKSTSDFDLANSTSLASLLDNLLMLVPEKKADAFVNCFSTAVSFRRLHGIADLDLNNENSLASFILILTDSDMVFSSTEVEAIFEGPELLSVPFSRQYFTTINESRRFGLPWNIFLDNFNPQCLGYFSIEDYIFFMALGRNPSEWQGVDVDEVKGILGEGPALNNALNILDAAPPIAICNVLFDFLHHVFRWVLRGQQELILRRLILITQNKNTFETKDAYFTVKMLRLRGGLPAETLAWVDPLLLPVVKEALPRFSKADPATHQLIPFIKDETLPEDMRREIACQVPIWLDTPFWANKENGLKAVLENLSTLYQLGCSTQIWDELSIYLHTTYSFEDFDAFFANVPTLYNSREADPVQFCDEILYDSVTNPKSFAFCGLALNPMERKLIVQLETKTDRDAEDKAALARLKTQYILNPQEKSRLSAIRTEAMAILVKRLFEGKLPPEIATSLTDRALKKDPEGQALYYTILHEGAVAQTPISSTLGQAEAGKIKKIVENGFKAFLPNSPDYARLFPPEKTDLTIQIYYGQLATITHNGPRSGDGAQDLFLDSWKFWLDDNGYKLTKSDNEDGSYFYSKAGVRLYDGRTITVNFQIRDAGRYMDSVLSDASQGKADVVLILGHTHTAAILSRHTHSSIMNREYSDQDHAPIIVTCSCFSWPAYGPKASAALPEAQIVATDGFTTVRSSLVMLDALVSGLLNKSNWRDIRKQVRESPIPPIESHVYRFPYEEFTLKYRDLDGDGIPEGQDTVFNLNMASSIIPKDDLTFDMVADSPDVPLQDVISSMNGTFAYDNFLKSFGEIKLSQGDFENRAGWFMPETSPSDEEESTRQKWAPAVIKVYKDNEACNISLNLGYQSTSSLGLLMMSTYELTTYLTKNYELRENKSALRTKPLEHLSSEQEIWAFFLAVSYLSDEFRMVGGYKNENMTTMAEKMFNQFKEHYHLPETLTWKEVDKASYYLSAIRENPKNEKRLVEEKKAYEKIIATLLEWSQR